MRFSWRVQVDRDDGRVRTAAVADARAAAYRAGWCPTGTPTVTVTVLPQLDGLVELDVRFDVQKAATCADCGVRPAWGSPGAVRCRTCIARADRQKVKPDSALACREKWLDGIAWPDVRGTRAGAARHRNAGEPVCDACAAGEAAHKRAERAASKETQP